MKRNEHILGIFAVALAAPVDPASRRPGTAAAEQRRRAMRLRRPVPSPETPTNGKALYYNYSCYGCHGFNGETGRAFVGNWSTNLATEDNFIKFLRGRANVAPLTPSTSMPNFAENTLSDKQAKDIYAYIRTFKSNAPELKNIPTLNEIVKAAPGRTSRSLMEVRKTVDIADILDRSNVSAFQIGIFILCGLCLIMDGFDVQALGPVAPAIIKDWHVSAGEMGLAISAALVGILVGSILFSMIADRIGRRPVLIFATLFFAVVTLMTARVHTIGELRTIRFLAGMGLGGIMPNSVALVGEYSPRRLRVLLMIVVTNGFNVGAAIAGLISAWMIPAFGWRSVFIVGGAIPAVIGVLMLAFLPESLQFLALRGTAPGEAGQMDQAYQPGDCRRCRNEVHRSRAEKRRCSYFSPLQRRPGRRNLAALDHQFHEPAESLFSRQLVADRGECRVRFHCARGLCGSTLQAGGVAGTFLFSWLVERIGFVPVLGTAFTTACIAIALIGQPAWSLTPLFLIVFVAGFCVVGGQGAINALAATYYPTTCARPGLAPALGSAESAVSPVRPSPAPFLV